MQWYGMVARWSCGKAPNTPRPDTQMRVSSMGTLFSTLQATMQARQSMQRVTSSRNARGCVKVIARP
jgi:hypothetical protein